MRCTSTNTIYKSIWLLITMPRPRIFEGHTIVQIYYLFHFENRIIRFAIQIGDIQFIRFYGLDDSVTTAYFKAGGVLDIRINGMKEYFLVYSGNNINRHNGYTIPVRAELFVSLPLLCVSLPFKSLKLQVENLLFSTWSFVATLIGFDHLRKILACIKL